MVLKMASEMQVAPRTSHRLGMPWSVMVCPGLSWSARILAGYSRLGIHRHPSASNCFFSLLSAPLWGANNFKEKGNEVQIHHDWGLGCKVLGSSRQRGGKVLI